MDMSIEHMRMVSHAMFGITGIFAAVSAVLFFALDIAKCWRMVSGKHAAHRKKYRKAGRPEPLLKDVHGITEKLPETVLLGDLRMEETKVLCTAGLELIQDIVYMQDDSMDTLTGRLSQAEFSAANQ